MRWTQWRDITLEEAYLAARTGEAYAFYFPHGGSVKLDLSSHTTVFKLKWISIGDSEWGKETTVAGGGTAAIATPSEGPWAAAMIRE